jgi:hypothetical protein
MATWRIFEAYGAWVASDGMGNTIWAMSEGELVRLFGGAA